MESASMLWLNYALSLSLFILYHLLNKETLNAYMLKVTKNFIIILETNKCHTIIVNFY